MTAQALHTEIKGKKEKVEDVQKNADTCATSIKVGSQIVRTFILKHFVSQVDEHKQVWYKTMT